MNGPAGPVHRIAEEPIHIGLGARAIVQPPFTGMPWYEAYSARHAADGAEGRLVSCSTFNANWGSWEMHPQGDEVVICLSGAMTLIQQLPDGSTRTFELGAGDYAINGAGIWHTADVEGEATALFITAGAGTEHRSR